MVFAQEYHKDMLPTNTHEVFNVVPNLSNYNAAQCDYALMQKVSQQLPAGANQLVVGYGKWVGNELIDLGFKANNNLPVLNQFDSGGNRVDWVEFHPAYHQIMNKAIESGLHCIAWENDKKGYGHQLRAALLYLHGQTEAGTACPISMTYAAKPVLRNIHHPLGADFNDRLMSRTYDPSNTPYFEKKGVTLGMAMTEKQGGSDVRANQTFAEPISDGVYQLKGHKWFCSAPMSDGFLVTANTKEGITCFLVPRWQENGNQNTIYIQRLKDKLGNRSNASSEIEFHNTVGYLVGEPGKGIKTIIEMVMLTRFDCMVGSCALMRQALLQAHHHVTHRSAFGKQIAKQPMMINTLCDLQLEMEANLSYLFDVASELDKMHEPESTALLRIITTVGKYWICKTTPMFVNEAQEALGGLGYVEYSILPRLYREAPLNSIWEGCGNIQCLDIMRIMQKSPECFDIYVSVLEKSQGTNQYYDKSLQSLKQQIHKKELNEYSLRALMQSLYVLYASCQLMQSNNPFAELYINRRIYQESRFFGAGEQVDELKNLISRIQVA